MMNDTSSSSRPPVSSGPPEASGCKAYFAPHLLCNVFICVLVAAITACWGVGLRFYPLTLGFPLQAVIGAVVGSAGLALPAKRYALTVTSSYVVLSLFVAWLVGGMGIPGGDDGTGLHWFLFGALLCLGTYILGIATLVTAVREKAKSLPPAKAPG